jgi:hypothetical protein
MRAGRVPAGARWEGIGMTSLSALRRASVALIVPALIVAACGGGTPTAAPSAVAATAPSQTFAPSAPPATTPPVVTLPPSSAAPTTAQPGVDPSADLEIAAPYTLAPLDEAFGELFVQAMRSAMGDMADVFDVGLRSAVKNGSTTSWIMVMRFPDFGFDAKTLLDLAATGAAGGQDVQVEKDNIGGIPVRIIESQGSAVVVTVLGSSDLVMVIPLLGGKKEAVAVTTALIEAN